MGQPYYRRSSEVPGAILGPETTETYKFSASSPALTATILLRAARSHLCSVIFEISRSGPEAVRRLLANGPSIAVVPKLDGFSVEHHERESSSHARMGDSDLETANCGATREQAKASDAPPGHDYVWSVAALYCFCAAHPAVRSVGIERSRLQRVFRLTG